jgi:hypothetical protein
VCRLSHSLRRARVLSLSLSLLSLSLFLYVRACVRACVTARVVGCRTGGRMPARVVRPRTPPARVVDSRGDTLTTVRRRSIPAICLSRQRHPPPAGPSCFSLAAPTSAAYSRVCTIDRPPANAHTQRYGCRQTHTRNHSSAHTVTHMHSHACTHARRVLTQTHLLPQLPKTATFDAWCSFDGKNNVALKNGWSVSVCTSKVRTPCALLNYRLLHVYIRPPPHPHARTQTRVCVRTHTDR